MSQSTGTERAEFLTDVFVTAIEHTGYGWFTVDEYKWSVLSPTDRYAIVVDDNDGEEVRIDLGTIREGLRVIREARVDPLSEERKEAGLVNNATGERLYMSGDQRQRILDAERNHDAGELDVVDALAVVECGLFGAVTYA